MATRKEYFEIFVLNFGFYNGLRADSIYDAYEQAAKKVKMPFYILEPQSGEEFDGKEHKRLVDGRYVLI
jgi:hypothetical protein